ncbi:MAG: putative Histidine kinase [Candidatus Saccharibacteria bacterium]|nr:putative Histidine kinase [Candidatus Saccharibacteria bacterium]
MIRSAVLRLSLLYLAIIMAISIGFSCLLYSVATGELERELQHPPTSQLLNWEQLLDYDAYRMRRLSEGRDHIKSSLVLLNAFTLAAAGGLSYYAARRTFKPIGEALEAQSRFASDASHELRTPLAAMQAEIEVMLRDTDVTREELRNQLTSNLEEIAKLQRLSDSLLRLARQSEPLHTFGGVKLSDIVREATKRFDKAAKQKNVSFEIDLDDAASVRGDADALTELLSVLLDNAVKYSPEKSTVKITGHIQQHRVILTVADSGPGITAMALPHLFERFYRADSSRNKSTSGYGLGLAIAAKIVQQHGGTIKAYSDRDKGGATFTVSLPKY